MYNCLCVIVLHSFISYYLIFRDKNRSFYIAMMMIK